MTTKNVLNLSRGTHLFTFLKLSLKVARSPTTNDQAGDMDDEIKKNVVTSLNAIFAVWLCFADKSYSKL